MRWLAILLAASLPLAAVACGATITQTSAAGTTAVVTSASATFMTRDDGKDEDSAATVQLLDVSGRLMAEGTVVDVEFDDQTVSEPLRLAATRAASIADLDRGRVRLRLTPDGRDTWVFDLRLELTLSDATARQYFWSGLRLDEGSPEKVLELASGRVQ